MKKLICAILVSFSCLLLRAQNVDAGKKLFDYQRYESAAKAFQEAIRINVNNAEAYFWEVLIMNNLKDNQNAKNFINSVPAAIAQHPFIKAARGMIALNEKDSIAARNFFNAAIGNDRKKDPAVQLAVALANIESDNGDKLYAIGIIDEAVKKEKRNPALYVAEGDAYRKLLDGNQAFRAYRSALDINKSCAAAYYKLGKIYQSQDNKDVMLENYDKALQADPLFTPVYYQLYYYYFYHDPVKAATYLEQYIANADKSIENDYMKLDLLYVSKKYMDAITLANTILEKEGNAVKPRIYKLLAFCYDQQKDEATAYSQLQKYFNTDKDSSHYSEQDYDLMGRLSESKNQPEDALQWYQKAFWKEKDTAKRLSYMVKFADFYKKEKNYTQRGYWLGLLYSLKPNASNVDLFSWGLAEFHAKEYKMADSIFAIYQAKYPEQTFGYYWRARSNAAIDTAMETGIAIPHYDHLIEVASKDISNATNRKWLIEAYGYEAAFKANKDKQYDVSLSYYDKILSLDPANTDAMRYKELLEKMIQQQKQPDKQPNNAKENTAAQKADKKGSN